MDDSQKRNKYVSEQKKLGVGSRGYNIVYNSIYMKFAHRQNQSIVKDVNSDCWVGL